MNGNWLPAPGDKVSPTDLVIPKAKGLMLALTEGAMPYVEFVECRRVADVHSEVVVLDVEVELCQRLVNDIKRLERIAVEFDVTDSTAPAVLALREGFPIVPHLNLRDPEIPRCLCLNEKSYDELKVQWTPTGLINDIRTWLALTAKGKLHASDQELEPLLPASSLKLIIPPTLLSQENECVRVRLVDSEGRGAVLMAEPIDAVRGSLDFVALTISGQPQAHGVIRKPPRTLFELSQFLSSAGIDLLEILRDRFRRWATDRPEVLSAKLVIITLLPKTRSTQQAEPERLDLYAFSTWETVKSIGVHIDFWQQNEGGLGYILAPDPQKQGQGVTVDVLSPIFPFAREQAAKFNGVPVKTPRMVQIGVGALGSQILVMLARCGYGEWTLIDDDFLLPHNLARHALGGGDVGRPKAKAMANLVNALYPGTAAATEIVANVLHPNSKAGEVAEALLKAQVILDCSASVAVARFIGLDVPGEARRISAFVNPSGTDLVVLVEDEHRHVRLDWLEMEYYRSLLQSDALSGHFSEQDSRRYGNSCRDVSAVMSQESMAQHAAISSKAIRRYLESPKESASVWITNERDFSVQMVSIETHSPHEIACGEWTVKVDDWFMDKIATARNGKLPNETGGILVGSVDATRKILYVVDTILSPPDSKEWPTVYIRGCEGLREAIEGIQKRTGNMLQYVGEWHSHPQGFGCSPSCDDVQAFQWLVEHMAPTGIPALMMIAGDTPGWYVGHIERY